jgi:hypothetical protein
MKALKLSRLIIFVLIFTGLKSHAEVYRVDEKCQVTEKDFSLSTNLKSVVEDAISEHKYRSTLILNGQTIAMAPESEIDETPMSIGSTYSLIDKASADINKKKQLWGKPNTKIMLTVRKGIEKSSFSSTKDNACGPVSSVKEYDVRIRGLSPKVIMAKMVCNQRSVFVSTKCADESKVIRSARR